ncbi:hypothetical protein FRUB_02921 [Fimbriiglobus ruber]|uniref:Uncharacterized protein n=1 Tax=Fimbriiglobus ruber TaxID=1908690 RepID=A0A225DPK2_9BACT|nr:hypothetical protein FRUB_02921 [Fimbriiglobus ruber]
MRVGNPGNTRAGDHSPGRGNGFANPHGRNRERLLLPTTRRVEPQSSNTRAARRRRTDRVSMGDLRPVRVRPEVVLRGLGCVGSIRPLWGTGRRSRGSDSRSFFAQVSPSRRNGTQSGPVGPHGPPTRRGEVSADEHRTCPAQGTAPSPHPVDDPPGHGRGTSCRATKL